jgi:uncharacterized protein (TIGR03086 family)
MEFPSLMVPAARTCAAIVRAVPADRLGARTPCPEWDVRAIVNHLTFWAGRGVTAAHKSPPAPEPTQDHDFTAEPGWADRYAEQALKCAEAWSDPAAWKGTTSLTGAEEESPASWIGAMLLGECVLHGWDLAVATGQPVDLPDDLVQAAHDQLVPTAAMGREYGAFGPEVPVAGTAPTLRRLLGLAGRNPNWTP